MDSNKRTKETNEFTLNPKENDSELILAFLSEVVKRYPHLKGDMECIDGETHG